VRTEAHLCVAQADKITARLIQVEDAPAEVFLIVSSGLIEPDTLKMDNYRLAQTPLHINNIQPLSMLQANRLGNTNVFKPSGFMQSN